MENLVFPNKSIFCWWFLGVNPLVFPGHILSNLNNQGIFPDVMHISHLALMPDVITSTLLDWSDDQSYVAAPSRDKRLQILWDNYRWWCEDQRYPMYDRAQRKLFTASVLKPDSGKYVELSQKVLNASSARYMVFWLAHVAKGFADSNGSDADMPLGSHYQNLI